MPRLWLAALGAAALLACGDDTSGGGPNDLFPDVAGTYTIAGDFDGVTGGRLVHRLGHHRAGITGVEPH